MVETDRQLFTSINSIGCKQYCIRRNSNRFSSQRDLSFNDCVNGTYVSQSVYHGRDPIKNLFIVTSGRQMIGDYLSTLIRMLDCIGAALLISLLSLSVTFPSCIDSTTTMEDIQLSKDQIAQLKMGFDAFDPDKKGIITSDTVGTILGMMGMKIPTEQLSGVISEFDPFESGELSFQDFCGLASRFMEEDMDNEAVQQELREAFRLYDKEGNGYITTDVFRDILHELDDALSPDELDMIIDEVDADGSGTVDFEEFMEVMTG